MSERRNSSKYNVHNIPDSQVSLFSQPLLLQHNIIHWHHRECIILLVPLILSECVCVYKLYTDGCNRARGWWGGVGVGGIRMDFYMHPYSHYMTSSLCGGGGHVLRY